METRKLLSIMLLFIITMHTPIKSDDTYTNINHSDSVNLNVIIEEFNIESSNDIVKCQIILNNDSSILRTQNSKQWLENKFTQVSLNRKVTDWLKKSLSELYTTRSSALLENIPEFKYIKNTAMPYWSINLTINNRHIEEKIPYESYIVYASEGKEVFHEQFYKIRLLIWTIENKIRKEIYQINTHFKNETVWITEMFHDEYYLPYNDNDINSNK